MTYSEVNSCTQPGKASAKDKAFRGPSGTAGTLRLFLLAVTTTLLLGLAFSCKKEKGVDTKTTLELMTSSSWKLDTIGLDMDKDGEIDGEIPDGFIEDCDKDNILTFNSNYTGIYAEGPTKCDENGPDAIPFTWSLKENDKVLVIEGELPEQLNGNINILSVTDTELILSKQFQITTPIPFSTNLVVRLKK